MFLKIIKFLWVELIYNGHLQSLGAAGIVYGSSKLFNLPLIPYSIITSYLLFQLIYIHDRYHDLSIDYVTNKVRSDHLLSYIKFIPLIFLIYLTLISYLYYTTAHIAGIIFGIGIFIMGILYPIYFKKLTKKIFLFKNFYVSSVFALMTIYGNLYFGIPIGSSLFLLLVFVYILVEAIIMQFTLDCKDIPTDKENKLLTLPVRIGKDIAIRVIYSLILIKALLYLALIIFDYNEFSRQLIILVGVTTLLNIYTTYLIARNRGAGYLISSGKFVLWAVVFKMPI